MSVLISTALLLFLIVFSSTALIATAQTSSPTIYAYIAYSDNDIAVIDTATNTVTNTIEVGSIPFGVVVTSDGTKAYVTNSNDNTVSVIDTATSAVMTVNVGKNPHGIAVNPTGTKVYVANSRSETVSVIDTITDTVTATVNGLSFPEGVAVSPDGTKVYVTNNIADGDNKVSVIDTATNTVIDIINVGTNPKGVAVSPTGTKVFVTDGAKNIVSVIDANTKATATVGVGKWPCGIAVTPDGTKAYVANQDSNNVSVIDTATNKVIATEYVGSRPCGVAVTPDGTKVYVTNEQEGSVSVIDATTNTVAYTVSGLDRACSFGQFIGSFSVKDPTLPVADFSASVTGGYAPLSVTFTDLSQKATSRSWDVNNDGVEDSSEASFVYEYTFAGTYTAKLTAINTIGTNEKTATIIVDRESSGGSSSGGGGGGGGSPEPAKNVEVKELAQMFITNGKAVKFDFTNNATCVVYIGFDSIRNAGKTTAIAEQLKGKSECVPKLPQGEVYKSFNVWVGNSGLASPKNIENPTVCFKVEKSWLQDKKIDQDSITLNRYTNETWEQLPVNPRGDDDKYFYFTADVPGYSFFAITGTSKDGTPEPEKNVTSVLLSISPNPSTFGKSITLSAKVDISSQGIEKPSGTVTFMDGTSYIETKNLNSGEATLTTSSFSVGSHSIIAKYNGDNNFESNNSSVFSLTVQKSPGYMSRIKSFLSRNFDELVVGLVVGGIITIFGTILIYYRETASKLKEIISKLRGIISKLILFEQKKRH